MLVRELSQPSPTVNTKEAMNLMQEMWGQGSSSEKPGFQIFQEPATAAPKENIKPKFQIFEEQPKPVETNTNTTASKAKFQVFQEPPVTKNISSAKKVPPKPKFEIYVEPPLAQQPEPAKAKFEIFQDKENAKSKPAPRVNIGNCKHALIK